MNSSIKSAVKYAALFQTASFLALANSLAAQAQTTPGPVAQVQTGQDQAAANLLTGRAQIALDQAAPNVLVAQAAPPAAGQLPEQVLVTGSLIHGAAVVGVPVTGLTDQDFKETGSLTVADVLKELPSVSVQVSNAINENGGFINHGQAVTIHNITSATATETLLMVDGIRFPPQGLGFCIADPSIIPQIALERVDVLADGASATYGSDALSGVVNLVLRRGFDGAVTQLQYGRSTDIGGATYNASQLYGRKWDSGDVTLSYEYYRIDPVKGPGRDYFTTDFVPFGYNNANPIGVSMPGVVSTGPLATNPAFAAVGLNAKAGNLACTNCYSVPAGTGWNFGAQPAGPTVSWTTLLANPGVLNEKNPAIYADALPAQDRNAATITFDQNLFAGVSLFFDGFYDNRRSVTTYTPGANAAQTEALTAIAVPTINPYYPSGAPSGLRVSYDLGGGDFIPLFNTGQTADRYSFGFNAILPFDWFGKLYYSDSEDHEYTLKTNIINPNMVTAALGGTVGAQAGPGGIPQGSFTKPANIPYLNLFCDASVYRCNSPTTLAYIRAYSNYQTHWQIGETGLNLDGPLFELPGGQVKAAVGANYYSDWTLYYQQSTFSAVNTSVPTILNDPNDYNDWATYAQLDIPLVGDANKLPLVDALSLQLSYRYDSYNLFGNVGVPKYAASWTVTDGFTLRANWGKAFRAPVPAETSPVNGALDQPLNLAAGDTTDEVALNCPSVRSLPSGHANAGSLNAALNPTCSGTESLEFPGIIQVEGGSGAAQDLRSGTGITPERSDNWNLGFNFTPTDPYLKGFSADVVWYNLIINGVISNNGTGVQNPNDPLGKTCTAPGAGCVFFVRANPNAPITDPSNATFLNMANALLSSPRSTVPVGNLSNIQVLYDTASTNLGFESWSGIDFDARYDFDLGDFGAWNAGVTGNYQLASKSEAIAGAPIVDNFFGLNSGGRLHYRARLGWIDTSGPAQGLSITGFLNFFSHTSNPQTARYVPAACFWAPAGVNGSTGAAGGCYPGSPYYGPFNVYPGAAPGMFSWDMSIGYSTGTRPENEYLRNVNIQLTVLDLLNKAPPFKYFLSGGQAAAAYMGQGISPYQGGGIGPLQRVVNIAITKSW